MPYGNDPKNSVVDKYHRAHDVPNLFIVDGSGFVTSGRNQPTCTIQALAYERGSVPGAKAVHSVTRLNPSAASYWLVGTTVFLAVISTLPHYGHGRVARQLNPKPASPGRERYRLFSPVNLSRLDASQSFAEDPGSQ
jgi:hypothetical protein